MKRLFLLIFVVCVSSLSLFSQSTPSGFRKGVYLVFRVNNKVAVDQTTSDNLGYADFIAQTQQYVDGYYLEIYWDGLIPIQTNGISTDYWVQDANNSPPGDAPYFDDAQADQVKLSDVINTIASYHKSIAIGFVAGRHSQPPNPGQQYVYLNNGNALYFTKMGGTCLNCQNGINYGTENNNDKNTLPVPWNPDKENAFPLSFETEMTTLYSVISGFDNPNVDISYVNFSGIQEETDEFRLPNDVFKINGNIDQNDYCLWNSLPGGYQYSISNLKTVFDEFLDNLYDATPAIFPNSVLVFRPLRFNATFPYPVNGSCQNDQITEIQCSKTPFEVNGYPSPTQPIDIPYLLLTDAINENNTVKGLNNLAIMNTSLDQDYQAAPPLDYVNMAKTFNFSGTCLTTKSTGSTDLCSTFKGFQINEDDFNPAANSTVMWDHFETALENGVRAGAQFIEIWPGDVYAINTLIGTETVNDQKNIRLAIQAARDSMNTISPDYNGNPALIPITLLPASGGKVRVSFPDIPGVTNHSDLIPSVSLYDITDKSNVFGFPGTPTQQLDGTWAADISGLNYVSGREFTANVVYHSNCSSDVTSTTSFCYTPVNSNTIVIDDGNDMQLYNSLPILSPYNNQPGATNTITDANISPNQIYVNGRFHITHNLNLAFASGNSVVIDMGPKASILVDPGVNLTLTNVTFQSCGDMWTGIKITSPTSSVIATGSLIQDADTAIYSSNDAVLTLKTCTFTDNWQGVELQNYKTANNEVTVTGCKFNRSAGSMSYPHANDSYYSTGISFIGSSGNVYFGVKMTNGAPNKTSIPAACTFTNGRKGIYSEMGVVTVYNSKFPSMDTAIYGNYKGPLCINCCATCPGNQIQNPPPPILSTINVGDPAVTQLACTAINTSLNANHVGIVTNGMNCNVYWSTFNYLGVGISNLSNGGGDIYKSFTFSNNSLMNDVTGVLLNTSLNSIAQITANTISLTDVALVVGNSIPYAPNGIYYNYNSTGGSASLTIDNNIISITNKSRDAYGVLLNNNPGNASITNNSITLLGGTTNNLRNEYGIRLNACVNATLNDNTLIGTPNSSTTETAISLSMSTKAVITCNNASSVNTGYEFLGPCNDVSSAFRFESNWMDNVTDGLKLGSTSISGWMNDMSQFKCDATTNFTPGNHFNNANVINGLHWVNGTQSIQINYGVSSKTGDQCTNCTPSIKNDQAAGGGKFAIAFSSADYSYQCGNCTDQLMSLVLDTSRTDTSADASSINIQNALDIIGDSIQFKTDNAYMQYAMKQNLYTDLLQNSEAEDSAQAIQTFADTAADYSIGKFYIVDSLLNQMNSSDTVNNINTTDSLMATAVAVNSSVNGIRVFEKNQKNYNDIYLKTFALGIDTLIASQKLTLQYIAGQCPYTGGKAVFEARGILKATGDTTNYNDNALCGQSIPQTDKNFLNSAVQPYFRILPNPGNHQIILNYWLYKESYLDYSITDMSGRTMTTGKLLSGNSTLTIDTQDFPPGIYIIHFVNRDGYEKDLRIAVVH